MIYASEEKTIELIRKYGVLDSIEKLRDERAKHLAESYPNVVSIPELYPSYIEVLDKMNKIKEGKNHLSTRYIHLTSKDVDNQLETLCKFHLYINPDKKQSLSPINFNFILNLARDNLHFAIVSYELTQAEGIGLPVASSSNISLHKRKNSLVTTVLSDNTYFFQRQVDIDFHNFFGN